MSKQYPYSCSQCGCRFESPYVTATCPKCPTVPAHRLDKREIPFGLLTQVSFKGESKNE